VNVIRDRSTHPRISHIVSPRNRSKKCAGFGVPLSQLQNCQRQRFVGMGALSRSTASRVAEGLDCFIVRLQLDFAYMRR
jgi:hypothetical protein